MRCRAAVAAIARFSASCLTMRIDSSRISTMPAEKRAQYQRNLRRADASVATARVSDRAIELNGLTASARSVHTIFT